MGRFLFGVLFAFGLWWGYDRFFGSAVDAAERPVAEAGSFSAPGDGEVPATGGTGLVVPPPADRGSGEAVAAVTPGFAAARGLTGADRDQAVAALVREGRQAETPSAAVDVLGPGNDFLHVVEGRALAGEVATRIEELPPWDAVRTSTGLMEVAMRGEIAKEHVEARAAFDELAGRHLRLVQRTVFNPADLTGARRYEVKRGDNLIGIARHLRKTLDVKVEAGTLQVVNRISNPRSIHEGQILKCPVGAIRTVVHKAAFVVAVYVDDVLVRTYWCAHGKPDEAGGDPTETTETPETTFVVSKKIEKPDWHHGGRLVPFGDPDNPLGTLFVGFEHPTYSSYGIHGTNDPESICTMASLGCIRLGESDIAEFFRFVPRKTEVEVRR